MTVADPVAYSFWAPKAQPMDYGPLLQAGANSAAMIVGAGQAIGRGIEKAGDVKREQDQTKKEDDAAQAFGDIIDEYQNPKNTTDLTVLPILSDPNYSGLHPLEAVAKMADDLIASGVPEEQARERAARAGHPVVKKVLTPEAAARFRGLSGKATVLARKAGMDVGQAQKVLELARPGAYETSTAALDAVHDEYWQNRLGSPQEQAMIAKARLDQEGDMAKINKLQAFDLEKMDKAYSIDTKRMDDQQVHAIRMANIDAEIKNAFAEKDYGRAERMATFKMQSDVEQQRRIDALPPKREIAVVNAQNEARIAIAEAKADAGGGLTREEGNKADEFQYVARSSMASGQAFMPASLSAVTALMHASGLGDTVEQDTKAQIQSLIFAGDGRNASKAIDLSRFTVHIGSEGTPRLTDKEGGVGPEDLKKIATHIFGNELAVDAVVLAQMYGGVYQGESDLEQVSRVNRKLGLTNVWRRALAQGATGAAAADNAQTGTAPNGARPFGPRQGTKVKGG